MIPQTPLAQKLREVQSRIAAAAIAARRSPSEVTLVAVTKTAVPEQIREILALGIVDLGESRVQQLVQRSAQLTEYLQRRVVHAADSAPSPRPRWHMIGHLQRNKVKALLPSVQVIHGVDSLRLAEELETQSQRAGKRQAVMLQLNAGEEPQKFGVAVGAAVHLGEQIASMPHLALVGLMTMAPLDAGAGAGGDKSRRVFARTREVFEEMRWHKIGGPSFKHLSMGMSHDFELAIAEGATMVRIGTALFGGEPHHEEQLADEG